MGLNHHCQREVLLVKVAYLRLQRCKHTPMDFNLLQKLIMTNGRLKYFLRLDELANSGLRLASLNGIMTTEYKNGKEK